MRLIGILTTILVAGVALAGGRSHHHSRGDWDHGMSISFDGDGEMSDCGDVRIRFDGQPAVLETETLNGASLQSLRLHDNGNGSIRVNGSDAIGYSIKVCKAAALPSDLKSIHASLQGNEVVTTGPGEEDRWAVFYLVSAPRNGAALDLQTNNGGIGLHRLAGNIKARAENGPVSLDRVSGTIDARTENGPISVNGGSGAVKVAAENGPVTVRLEGTTWEGGSLNATTVNGPVSVRVPPSFTAGVVVESDGHGPMRCRAEGCRGAKRFDPQDDDDSDRPRRFELGSGAPVVHVATVNGPVSVRDRGEDED